MARCMGARMEYILMNCVLALLDYPGATLLGINRLLSTRSTAESLPKSVIRLLKHFGWLSLLRGLKVRDRSHRAVQNK